MSDQTTEAYYRTRTRNMAVTIIVVSITPLLLVTSLILYEFRHSYREKVDAHLIELVQKHRQNIDSFVTQRLGDIRILAETFGFEALSDEAFLKQRLTVLQQVYGPVFVDLGIIDAKGIQHAYAGPFKLAGADYSRAPWFHKAMQKEYFVSDVFLGLRNLPHFIVAVRKDWKGEPWILRATVDFVAFNALVEKIRMGQTGFAFILNREGELQTKPYLDIVSDNSVFLNLLKGDRKPGDRVRVMEMADASGKMNLYVAAPLKDRDWILVYQQNAADAFSDLRRAQGLTLAIILIGSLGIATTAIVISRRLFHRIARADREKEMMNEQIVETGKLASVGELAAGIAHEINNPVAIMVEEAGWIEDLLGEEEFKEGENLEEFRRALRQIKNQGRRCKEITHKLLSFARKTDARVQEVQINDMVEEMVALSAQRAKFSNVAISTTLDERLPTVRVSQSELQQVLLNLINNALDAMEKKGGRLSLTTQRDENFVTIFVADTGPGIPRANLERIFDPFFTTKPVGKGTGLGLSICYGIIKKIGGDITVRSVVNMGTTFRIQIPLPKEEAPAEDTWVRKEGAS
jgi:two-component system NtrC family sensor kinase